MTEELDNDLDWTLISMMNCPLLTHLSNVYCFQCAARTSVAFYMDVASNLRGYGTATS
jgi:hypothetical protein